MRRRATVCRLLAALVLATGAMGCSQGQPTELAARQVVASIIDEGDQVRLALRDFRKVDGKAMEVLGVKAYEMEFSARAEFLTDAIYQTNYRLLPRSIEKITTAEIKPGGRPIDESVITANGMSRASKGDALSLVGSMTFEQKESGWVVVALNISLAQ